jgi:hypothetical protein
VLRLVAGEQDRLTLLFTHSVGHQAGNAYPAIVSATITKAGLQPALEGAQKDPDLAAGAEQACTRRMRLADEFDRLLPVSSAGQPSASTEQKASHFFRSTSKAAISTMAFSMRWSSFLRALISRWSCARSFSNSLCSYGSASSPDYVYKMSTGFSLASWAAWRQRSTCSGNSPRSRQ